MITSSLPLAVYTPEQVRNQEAQAAIANNLSLYQLMLNAGQATFSLVQAIYRQPAKMLVVCGAGNNGGDGFVIAKLAKLAGWHIDVMSMPDCPPYKGDALTAYNDYIALGRNVLPSEQIQFNQYDVIIDAILGTGALRPLAASWSTIVDNINQASALTISVDIPSGLNATTGAILGNAIIADHTVTFIGVKSGLLTAKAADHVGTLHFADLTVANTFEQQNKPYYRRSEWSELRSLLPARKRASYKGVFGHVVCIGGDKGMAGAIKMAAESCLRSGAGLVSVITHPDNVLQVANGRPELMVFGVNGLEQTSQELIDKADVVLAGPGMGRTGWANGLMSHICRLNKPMVIDADGLNWLAEHPHKNTQWILTPHTGEAARLMAQNTDKIELDRYAANYEISARYGGISILKGAGTLITSSQQTHICTAGNPGMSSAGMGDVLAGICAAMLAQQPAHQYSRFQAAELAVCLHAAAGDLAAQTGERGMIASDLIAHIRTLVNP
ncbi:bifunctional ADP-dependent NAD(P)H-hydrate dehydratase/NAD(P)H-hydrate epimerase [Saccharobesus litoralis]|uniref:Bifunctional NAD(P)H-hydrate repair enzyme n=1 Tax=Saccharobesus litoralis TaxID=2172099 RepID=A0A2S0VWM4_9ALTE|nr:NAD(P)H-hydrate dehydratase [Saccharobesus litoralis]AWB68500.1 bifunctional ADP-dependent NAD(P)H-hydrate dehydratase/NAD(P)H-hydrate epimerase [Saccharobesus litoralis]